ncbi:MAG: caspase family protein [Pseudomonadales bacterium]
MKSNIVVRMFIVGALAPMACSTAPPTNTPAQTIAGDQSVHCLLPAQVRKLGNTVYPARRQLVFESETRCTLRGGEYTVYDRASAESSAEFYQTLAANGDAEAQYSLGLVYESLFSPPRYNDAARWYQQAADQNHANALKNLAFLYEQGFGVKQDPLVAVNLLRQSGGITDDLVLTSEMDAALSEAGAEVRQLTQKLEQQNSETASLQSQLALANDTIIQRRRELSTTKAELVALQAEAQQLSSAVVTTEPSTSTPKPSDQQAIAAAAAAAEQLREDMANKTRMVEEQELIIASLAADFTAQQAQLEASERKAALQEQRLDQQLAAVRNETGSSIAEAEQALAAKNAQIESLSSALAEAQQALAGQQSQQQSLLTELENKREALASAAGTSTELEQLLQTLAEREGTIANQSARISDLQGADRAASATAAEVRTLKTQLANLQKDLTDQQLGYTALEMELRATRQAVVQSNRGADSELDRLLAEVAQRSETIAEQKQQIETLSAQAGKAEQAFAELAANNSAKIEELDLVQAKLVSVEAELVRTQSSIVQLEGALQSSEMTQSALREENQRLDRQLEIAAGSNDAHIQDLRMQLSNNNQQLQRQAETISDLKRKIQARQVELAAVQEDRVQQLAMRSVPRPVFPTAPDIELSSGTKYALVIGNDEYRHLKNLTTAVNGARAIDDILRTQYGFETRLLLNATRRQIMVAFSELQQELEDDDQVLIYYAGHGERSGDDDAITYWLPVDAEENQMSYEADGIKSTWITNEMRAMKAKHVMIVADSCYAGAMVRPVRVSVPSRSIDERRLKWMVKRRSRTVLTSGGNRPVLDESPDGTHSVFTQALVSVLSENPGVIYGEALHAALVQLVRYNAEQLDFNQVPLFSEVADANHGNGQFVMKNIKG